MKVVFWVLLTLCIGGLVAGLAGGGTPRRQARGYIHVRPGGVTADDAELTVTNSAWSTVRGWVEIPEEWDSLSISVYAYGDGSGAGDPHGAVADCNLYVAHAFGSAIHVCRFSVEVGNLRLSHDPAYGAGSQYRRDEAADENYKWAEGPFVLNESFWRTPIWMSGKVDGIGELNFNHQGATHVRVQFDNMQDATRWQAVMTGRRKQ